MEAVEIAGVDKFERGRPTTKTTGPKGRSWKSNREKQWVWGGGLKTKKLNGTMKASECYKLCNRELDCRPEERDFLVTWKRTLARLDDFDRTFATAAQKLVMSTKPEEARCKWNGKGGSH